MNRETYRKLKDGDRVRHVDGTVGTVVRQRGFAAMEVVWDDAQRQVMHADSQTDAEWAESDIEIADHSATTR
jgi:hypothetical protein